MKNIFALTVQRIIKAGNRLYWVYGGFDGSKWYRGDIVLTSSTIDGRIFIGGGTSFLYPKPGTTTTTTTPAAVHGHNKQKNKPTIDPELLSGPKLAFISVAGSSRVGVLFLATCPIHFYLFYIPRGLTFTRNGNWARAIFFHDHHQK